MSDGRYTVQYSPEEVARIRDVQAKLAAQKEAKLVERVAELEQRLADLEQAFRFHLRNSAKP